ncbi:MAG: SPFH domain-containing protein, partial [Bacteroidia bacterium]|nr:SPFH domain-containing protein [Bacteroidia bacterium]
MKTEQDFSPVSGYLILAIVAVLLLIGFGGLIALRNPMFIWLVGSSVALMPGFFFINPNSSVILVLFGDYKGTVKLNGFH